MSCVAEHMIQAADGTQLAVYHWISSVHRGVCASNKLCIVLVHPFTKMGGSGALMRGLAKCLTRHGFPVVTFDMRGAGKSLGKSTWTGWAEVYDVVAVSKWVIDSLHHDVILIGSSAGAPIAGSALKIVPDIRGFVSIGYVFGWFASWLFGKHYHAISETGTVPKLFIMGERDGFTSVSQLKARAAACAGTVSVLVVPSVGHFELESAAFDIHVTDAIVQWLGEHGPEDSRIDRS
eukprot:jgi/Ulvmu1/5915/UM026_0037.1